MEEISLGEGSEVDVIDESLESGSSGTELYSDGDSEDEVIASSPAKTASDGDSEDDTRVSIVRDDHRSRFQLERIYPDDFQCHLSGVKWPPTCPVCYHIIRACHAPVEIEYSAVSKPLQSIFQTNCKVHKAMFRAARLRKRIEPAFGTREIEVIKRNKSRHISIVDIFYPKHGEFISMQSGEAFILVKRPEESPSHPGQGLVLDEEWVYTGVLRRWYETCKRQHSSCRIPSLIQTHMDAKPRYLVDTEADCIVTSSATSRYVALSYVWGNAECLKTERNNLAQLQIPGALRQLPLEIIPRTIQHAMKTVQLLGERYLWVDALCIVQDDEESKQQCLDDMAAIYANAALTIQATEGMDANHGLRGIRSAHLPVPRRCRQDFVEFGSEERFVKPVKEEYKDSTYESRAWTFQESLFSHKILKFSNVVSWCCTVANWTEDVDFYDENHVLNGQHELGLDSRHPDLNSYCNLVQVFNNKKLTYAEDRLSAFAGITTVLSMRFYGGFLCGLPRMFFDISLLWQPYGLIECRTISSGRMQSSTARLLPSWSWAGWNGSLDLRVWRESRNPAITPSKSALETISIMTWYTSNKPQPRPEEMYEAVPAWVRSIENLKTCAKPLPEGWTRTVLLGHDDEFFTHSNFPGTFFRYPFSIGDISKSEILPVPTPYLHGATERSWLFTDGQPIWISAAPERYDWAPKNCIVSLYTGSHTWAGVLHLHTNCEKGQFWMETPRISQGYQIELIAISRGVSETSDNIEEWDFPQRPKDGGVYEFYNVLWITRVQEIAYRKALGRVRRDIWESLNREAIQVTLG